MYIEGTGNHCGRTADWCKKCRGSDFVRGSLWFVNYKDELKLCSNLKIKCLCMISWAHLFKANDIVS